MRKLFSQSALMAFKVYLRQLSCFMFRICVVSSVFKYILYKIKFKYSIQKCTTMLIKNVIYNIESKQKNPMMGLGRASRHHTQCSYLPVIIPNYFNTFYSKQ